MAQGLVSGKYQLTLPVEVRKALGIRPGDRVEYTVKGGRLEVRVIRPDLSQVLDEVLAEHDFADLRAETQGDAVRFMREMRGLGEGLDD
jgi:AbrB family looped-hinge helix DNA binding protein